MIEASGEEKININKKIRKYKRQIDILVDGKLSTLVGMPLLKLVTFVMLSSVFYVLFGVFTMITSLSIPLLAFSIVATVLTEVFIDKQVDKKRERDKNFYYLRLSAEEKQQYNEIIEEAKQVAKTNDSKKLKKFIKSYEIKFPYYSVEDVEMYKDVSKFCTDNNMAIKKREFEQAKNSKRKEDKEENLKINLTRSELEQLLNGETILLQEPIEIKMKEDVYSSLTKDDNALKENSRKNKSMIKKLGGIK